MQKKKKPSKALTTFYQMEKETFTTLKQIFCNMLKPENGLKS